MSRFLILSAVLALAEPLLYAWLLRSGSAGEAWRRGRLLMLVSAAAILLAAAGVGGGLDAEGLLLSVPVLLIVQGAAARLVDRRLVSVGVLRLGERVYPVRVIDTARPVAFTLAATGRIYASRGLVEALPPEEAAAVLAHEAGHGESLRPLPAWLVLSVLVAGLAWLAEGVLDAAAGEPLAAAAAAAIGVSSWVAFNWAWEHLADVYSLASVGAAAITALSRVTGAAPEPPSPGRVAAEAFRSLRPRRSAGLLVNPHPPPQLRLWLLLNLLQRARGPVAVGA